LAIDHAPVVGLPCGKILPVKEADGIARDGGWGWRRAGIDPGWFGSVGVMNVKTAPGQDGGVLVAVDAGAIAGVDEFGGMGARGRAEQAGESDESGEAAERKVHGDMGMGGERFENYVV
jgi:hypothetical protein